MRTMCLVLAFVAAAHADWVDLGKADFESMWTPVAGTWTRENGVIRGTATADRAAVLVSTRDYFDFELEIAREGDAGSGRVGVRAHWLPDAPDVDAALPLVGVTLDLPGSKGTVNVRAVGATVKAGDRTVSDDDAFIGGRIALIVPAGEGASAAFHSIRVNDLGREGTWRALFNGTNFDGWTIWGTEEWTVEDGVIIGRSGPKKSEGYLATEKTWTDFRVRGMFKMLGDGNFGLFYHSTIAYNEEQYPMISGLQGEVAPGYPSPSGWVYESYKRGWLVQPDMETYRAFALRPGEWNEIEIRSVGNRVTTWVNGIRVLDLEDKDQQLTEGSFALQLHTGGTDGIQWKDLYVLED